MRGLRGPHSRRRSVRGLRRVRIPRLPALLRVREEGGQPVLPSVQDQVQEAQRSAILTISRSNLRVIYGHPEPRKLGFEVYSHNLSLHPVCDTGCPRVEGDEEEEDVDDLDNELSYADGQEKSGNPQRSQGEDDLPPTSTRRDFPPPYPLLPSGGQSVW